MDWLEIVSNLAAVIPLVVALCVWIKKAIEEKNWQALLSLVTNLMQEAEVKFETGADRKDYVIMAIKASADTINYKIDIDVVSKLIDDLCSMSKIVNAPTEDKQN